MKDNCIALANQCLYYHVFGTLAIKANEEIWTSKTQICELDALFFGLVATGAAFVDVFGGSTVVVVTESFLVVATLDVVGGSTGVVVTSSFLVVATVDVVGGSTVVIVTSSTFLVGAFVITICSIHEYILSLDSYPWCVSVHPEL